jgi:hypothetical protein
MVGLSSYLIFWEPWLLYKNQIFDCFIPMIKYIIIERRDNHGYQIGTWTDTQWGFGAVSNTRPTLICTSYGYAHKTLLQ